MGILAAITKEVFEANVPVAKMPDRNTSVFTRMEVMLKESYDMLIQTLVSPDLEGQLEEETRLRGHCIRLVCLNAFVRTCRSLDLVLTATGFGIVSTESTAPASKSRVEALVEEVACEEIKAIDEVIQQLVKIESWGATEQAEQRIPTLFYLSRHLKRFTTLPLSRQGWQTAQGRAITADALLREEVGDEYMDELLQKTRTASLNSADVIVVEKCNRFTGDFLSNYELTNGCPNQLLLRQIVHQLESYRDSYPTYCQSMIYAKRHAQRYENKKEDSSFFFM